MAQTLRSSFRLISRWKACCQSVDGLSITVTGVDDQRQSRVEIQVPDIRALDERRWIDGFSTDLRVTRNVVATTASSA